MDEDISKLFELVQLDNLKGLKELVEDVEVKKRKRDSILDSVDEDGYSVLHWAAQDGNSSIIQWLLSSAEEGGRTAGFSNVLAKTNKGRTALHVAAIEGHFECCQALVEGSLIDNGERAELLRCADNDGRTILHVAAEKGHREILAWLLNSSDCAAGFDLILAKTNNRATAMHLAAWNGHLECCQALVEASNTENGERAELLNGTCYQGGTILHWAAFQGHASITNIFAKTHNGATAMYVAASSGHLECCQALVEGSMVENGERDELLNVASTEGGTILHWAANGGHPSIIRWLLSPSEGGGRGAGFTNVLARTNDGATAMHAAASSGHLDCCQALVEGCNIDNGERAELLNAVETQGWTVLHLAVQSGHPQILKWLLSSSEGGGRGAGFSNVLAKTNKGATAIHLAAGRGQLECCQALVEGSMVENGERAELLNDTCNEGGTILHWAAHEGNQHIVRWLLSPSEGGGRAFGFNNILAKTINGSNALHFAALKGHLECCQALVEGAKLERAELLNGVKDEGWTILHSAAQKNHPHIIRWLLSSSGGGGRSAGFDNVLARTKEQKTALHLAAFRGHLECCKALVEGSTIGERDELLNSLTDKGWTVLHIAAYHGHSSVIRWLLSSSEGGGRAAGLTSASVRARISDSSSALHLVAEEGNLEALNALLSGCSVGERLTLFLSVDEHGWTPLHAAARCRKVDVIRELLLHHPQTQTIVDARDHRGMTALHRAVIGGIDEESRKEWREDEDDNSNVADAAVISALLTASKKQNDDVVKQQQTEMEDEDDDKQKQGAVVDPNLGIKIQE